MRRILKLMTDWSFVGGEERIEGLELPHTWNNRDGQDGGNDYRRGVGVYTRKVLRPEFGAEERVYLQFHGVNASARVLWNGREVCAHDGGYSTFRTDVTEYMQEENTLTVEVDNSVNDRVYPQKADFTFYGGIYRDVELLIVNQAHFDLDYCGGPGMQYTSRVDGTDGILQVSTYVNKEAQNADTMVKVCLLDHRGVVVASAEVRGTEAVASAETAGSGCGGENRKASGENKFTLQVPGVHLWDGPEDPYLYTLRAQLVQAGRVVDEITCNCGIRTFHFSPRDGFYLNGRHYPLHGVSRHQDRKEIGNAISYENMEQDMALIKEIGANTIRLAHYQHSQYFYDLCDKHGMIVWAEIPYISEHMPNGRENTFSQMKELIVQNFNHPSIVTWGISNEITISGKKHRKDMLDNHRALQKLCEEMDPTRPTTLACFAMCLHWNKVAHITDLVGWNLYLGWYVPGLFLNDLWIWFWHLLYPNRPLCYSEYGAEGMPNLHSRRPKRGDNSEEYQNRYHEFMLRCFKRHPYLWATYVWNMFDFAADARNQGGEPGMNHKGLVTFDRGLKKDSFYLYKAYWSKDSFVYLAGRRFAYRTGKTTTITVYSNQKEVALYNNGQLVERRSGEHVFKFRLKLAAENRLEAVAGEQKDSAVIYQTKQAKAEYKLKKGDSSNWM